MSLIGPRPERPEFVPLFGSNTDGYTSPPSCQGGDQRMAQYHGLRGQASISERAEWDNYYVDNFSLWLDAKIVVLRSRQYFSRWFDCTADKWRHRVARDGNSDHA